MREAGRWRHLADLLRDASEGVDVGPEVAALAARVLGVDDVCLALVLEGDPVVMVGSSEDAIALGDRQFLLGEGPTLMALRTGMPVLADDLDDPVLRDEAPVLAAEAAVLGIRAMFAFPLRIGGALLGVMTGQRRSPGALDAEQYADGLILSLLVALVLLEREAAARGARSGDPSAALLPAIDPEEGLREVVQVAAGMVSEQLDVPVVEGLVRIRAHAFVTGSSQEEVARRIVARELRLER